MDELKILTTSVPDNTKSYEMYMVLYVAFLIIAAFYFYFWYSTGTMNTFALIVVLLLSVLAPVYFYNMLTHSSDKRIDDVKHMFYYVTVALSSAIILVPLWYWYKTGYKIGLNISLWVIVLFSFIGLCYSSFLLSLKVGDSPNLEVVPEDPVIALSVLTAVYAAIVGLGLVVISGADTKFQTTYTQYRTKLY
jgi:hypothetical protein